MSSVESPSKKYVNFIKPYIVTGKGNNSNYYIFSGPESNLALNIPEDKEKEYIKLYIDAMLEYYTQTGKLNNLHVIQSNREIGILKLDFDFKCPLPVKEINRHVTPNLVNALFKDIKEVLNQFYDLTKIKQEAYVMYRQTTEEYHDSVKDGLHIEIPSIVANKATRLKIFESLIEIFEKRSLSSYTKYTKISKIFDKNVVGSVGWALYGSSKYGGNPYLITYKYDFDKFQPIYGWNESIATLVKLLSNHNKKIITPLKFLSDIKLSQEPIQNNDLSNEYFELWLEHDSSLKYYWKILNALAPKRSEVYDDWMRICWALRYEGQKINKESEMLKLFYKFSAKCPQKFSLDGCNKIWNEYNDKNRKNPTFGTILHYLKEDVNRETYAILSKRDINERIDAKAHNNITSRDIAELFVDRFENIFKFYYHSPSSFTLFHFKDHIWYSKNSYSEITELLSTDIRDLIIKRIIFHNKNLSDPLLNDLISRKIIIKNLEKCRDKLGEYDNKIKVVKELSSMIRDDNFYNKLNMNPDLIAFKNGVFDLKNNHFRPGEPSDYISLQCNCDYIPYNPNNPGMVSQVFEFFEQVLPNNNVRHYFLNIVASCLQGNFKDNKSYFMQGPGSSGKSTTIKLIEEAFGTYYGTLPISYFTQRRSSSNSTTNELIAIEHKRIVCSSETNTNETLNSALLKDLTGGNKFNVRGNFEKFREMKFVGRIFFQINNMPHLDYVGRAEKRRIRIIPFKTIFEYANSPFFDKTRHKPIDLYLDVKIRQWVTPFMSYLIWHYLTYVKDKEIVEPPEIVEILNEYFFSVDIFGKFLHENLIETKNLSDSVTIEDIIIRYAIWKKQNEIYKITDRLALKEYLKENFINYDSKFGILKGFKLKDNK